MTSKRADLKTKTKNSAYSERILCTDDIIS